MKYIRQFAIILVISFVGELIHYFVPLPIPASIYGFVILLVLLMSKKLHLNSVKATADLLIEIMPMMFIPAAAGLINSWDMIKPRLIPYIVVMVVSLVVVMLAAGRATQAILRKGKKS